MNLRSERKQELSNQVDELLKNKKYEKARDIVNYYKLKDYQICLTTLRQQYYYTYKAEREINLNYAEMENPHYSSAAPMRLYLEAEAKDVLRKRPFK